MVAKGVHLHTFSNGKCRSLHLCDFVVPLLAYSVNESKGKVGLLDTFVYFDNGSDATNPINKIT